jgi:hypothetical protein
MSIQRYYVDKVDMVEYNHGYFVLYEDHISEVKALQEEIALLKSKLNFDWDSIK